MRTLPVAIRRLLFLLLVAFAAAPGPLRAAADAGRGARVYADICMRCHDSDPMHDRPGSAARQPDGVRTAISAIPQMRWLAQRLSAQQVDDVQAWLDAVVLPAGSIRPQTGWYWDPLRPGRGYFFEYGHGQSSLAAFFYSETGRPDWTLAVGRYDGSRLVLEVDLQQFSDGQPPLRPWRPARLRPLAQPAALEILDERTLRLHVDGAALELQRVAFDFGSAPVPARPGLPQSGWWWDPQAPGSGYSLEFQGDQLLLAVYAYDEDGHAAWWLASGPVRAGGVFEAELQRFADGQTLRGEFRSHRVDPLGSLSVRIDFEGPRVARIRIGDAAPRDIRRFF